jgi:PAS domain S-box-containing protein
MPGREQSRRRNVRSRELIDQLPDLVLVTDASGRYVDANRTAVDVLGYDIDQIRRMRINDLVLAPEEWTQRQFRRLLDEAAPAPPE